MRVVLTVNGRPWSGEAPVRLTLSDLLRDRLGLTGTHVGCEQGACGACTVLADGEAVRSCLVLAVQADGMQVTTIEGLGVPGRVSALLPEGPLVVQTFQDQKTKRTTYQDVLFAYREAHELDVEALGPLLGVLDPSLVSEGSK